MAESVTTNVNVTPQIALGSADTAAATVEASQNLAAALVKSSQIQAQATASLASVWRPAAPTTNKKTGGLFSNPVNVALAGMLGYVALWK